VDRVEINGRPATAAELGGLAFGGYGHFTSMQVRGFRVRGLDLHLERLRRDALELFGRPVDPGQVLGHLRHAVSGGPGDLSVQVNVFSREDAAVLDGLPVDPDVLVRTGAPVSPPTTSLRVRTSVHERILPQVKHVATLGLVHHWRQARLDGFDDVLFCDRAGFVSEGSIWNIAFLDGGGIVWPDAPALRGITMQLVQAGLGAHGVASSVRPVHVSELDRFQAAVLMNSIVPGQPIAAIDGVSFGPGTTLLRLVREAYERNEAQALE
jgi:branched-subunit amino acid aminotransferase/4-amino-4-deoxychorismate lyase